MAASAAACTLDGLPGDEGVPGETEGRRPRPRPRRGDDALRGGGGGGGGRKDGASRSRATSWQTGGGGGRTAHTGSSSQGGSFASRRLDPSLLEASGSFSGSFFFFLGVKQIRDGLIGGTAHPGWEGGCEGGKC